MDILFVSCVYSEDKKTEYLKYSKRGFQFAAQTLQESLISGFISNGANITVLTQPSLSYFPFGYKKPIVKSGNFIYAGAKFGHTIGKLNIPFVGFSFAHKNLIRKWYNNSSKDRAVVVYSANPHMMKIAVWIKEKYPMLHVCYIIPDLPIYMGVNKYYKALGLKDRDNKYIYQYMGIFDSYVVLTENIAEAMKLSERKHIVIEGIFNPSIAREQIIKKEKIVFLYTGGLVEKYGIADLVKAFELVKNDKAELWLCGNGDAVDMIKEYSERDKRIKYKGALPHEEILKLQQQASFLVNPRHSKEDFIKYSFPSKTMEYMASGVPTLMCPLECLPDEYKEHLLFFYDETVEGMARRMEEVIEIDINELKLLGNKARRFILDNKTPEKQVRKILNIIR